MAFRHGKMAFLAGPRQVGKTTLAKALARGFPWTSYHVWEDLEFRRRWTRDPAGLLNGVPPGKGLLILDELHKAPRWKTALKGLYDVHRGEADIIVTGSARLDVFRRGGDSLLGRYFKFRVHPFTVAELAGVSSSPDDLPKHLSAGAPTAPMPLDKLLEGGFPEPYTKGDADFRRLWRRERVDRLVREDLRDLTRITELGLIQTLAALLPQRVGSLLSLHSLARELLVSPVTVQRWMEWLETVYYVYRVPPYARNLARSLKKQPKTYLWDWSEAEDDGARFENLVAGHLKKACDAWTDTGKGAFDLYHLRDKEKREVDFLVTRNRNPWLMVEAKSTEETPASALFYFAERLSPAMTVQTVRVPGIHKVHRRSGGEIHILSADRFLGLLV
jgi:hypothetical protein